MAVGEYQASTVVESSAGRLSLGRYSEKPRSTAARLQAGSSRRPSIVTVASVMRGMATLWPCARPAHVSPTTQRRGNEPCSHWQNAVVAIAPPSPVGWPHGNASRPGGERVVERRPPASDFLRDSCDSLHRRAVAGAGSAVHDYPWPP